MKLQTQRTSSFYFFELIIAPGNRQRSVAAVVAGFFVFMLGIAASQAATTTGTITREDGTLCRYWNAPFGKDVYVNVEILDLSRQRVAGPTSVNTLGRYTLTTPDAGGILRASCESGPITEVVFGPGTAMLDVKLPNNANPIIDLLVAKLGGLSVKGVPPESTVDVSVVARDGDGQPLRYQWIATDGVIVNTNTTTVKWTLPPKGTLPKGGLHFLYVLVSDGAGGFQQKQLAISTDDETAPVPANAPPPAAGAISDRIAVADHFFMYAGMKNSYGNVPSDSRDRRDTLKSACEYYRTVSAVNSCDSRGNPRDQFGNDTRRMNFSFWKQQWGFDTDPNELKVQYANLVDLNLQRDMHAVSRTFSGVGELIGNGVAYYVCNHDNKDDPNLTNAATGIKLVACVAMEYSVRKENRLGLPETGQPQNGGIPFTKFYTFGPDGKLLLSVNLDGRGEKFLPGTCVVCHGGGGYPGRFPETSNANGKLNAQFLPFDVDNFHFSTTDGKPNPDDEARIKQLNQLIFSTGPAYAVKELISGWYGGPTDPASVTSNNFNPSLPLATQKRDFLPPGWTDARGLYIDVVKPSCRTCHVAMRTSFNTFANFTGFASTISHYVCGNDDPSDDPNRKRYSMPNSRVTFDRFWSSNGPSVLKSSSVMGIPSCDPPPQTT